MGLQSRPDLGLSSGVNKTTWTRPSMTSSSGGQRQPYLPLVHDHVLIDDPDEQRRQPALGGTGDAVGAPLS